MISKRFCNILNSMMNEFRLSFADSHTQRQLYHMPTGTKNFVMDVKPTRPFDYRPNSVLSLATTTPYCGQRVLSQTNVTHKEKACRQFLINLHVSTIILKSLSSYKFVHMHNKPKSTRSARRNEYFYSNNHCAWQNFGHGGTKQGATTQRNAVPQSALPWHCLPISEF